MASNLNGWITYTEVLELIRAGYTRDEIAEMAKAAADPIKKEETQPEPEPAPEPKPAPPAEPAPAPEPKPAEMSETEKLVAALGMKFDSLTAALQKSNINNLEGRDNTQTTDDIIARIINPKMEG